jgi:subtilisin family serine protease
MPGVVGVTAVDSDGNPYRKAPKGTEVDFAAPGVRIWAPSTGNADGRYFSGTSFAAPYVTAMAALALQDGVAGTDALEQRLAENARDLGEAGKDPVFGWGLVRAASPCGPRA